MQRQQKRIKRQIRHSEVSDSQVYFGNNVKEL